MMASAISYRARTALIKPQISRDDEPEPEHEFSSLQINLPPKIAAAMMKIAAGIDKKDLKPEDAAAHNGLTADDGIEHESHVTARWGLHFQTPSARLRNALKEFGPVTLTLGKTSLFTGGDADVLKIDVDSPDLHRLYSLIGRIVPTHDTHPVHSYLSAACDIGVRSEGCGKEVRRG